MFTAISAIIGFLGSVFPQVLKFFQQKQDHKHQLEMLKAQTDAQVTLGAQRLEEKGLDADTQEALAVLKAATPRSTGVQTVDAIIELVNSLMRPVVVYFYFFEYLIIKYATYTILGKAQGFGWEQAVEFLWTDFDKAMFGGIMGFLFGNRAMGKVFSRIGK